VVERAVLVTGVSGFIGSRLADALVRDGYEVRAMTRNPDRYRGAGVGIAGDVLDVGSLDSALRGLDAAYYMVHSLGAHDLASADGQ
jgi:uncharacterized protein YbjT (DUF2867 family)